MSKLLKYLEDVELDEHQDKTVRELVNEFSEICFRDKFEFLTKLDSFTMNLKNEIIMKTDAIKSVKVDCECGCSIMMRHYDRHCRGSRHQKYIQDKD